MKEVFFVSGSEIYMADGNAKASKLPSEAVEKYRRNINEIEKRNEWKTSGPGAAFTGNTRFMQSFAEKPFAGVTSLYAVSEDKLIYAATLESVGGLYIKNPKTPDDPENFILRKENLKIFDMDYLPEDKKIIASVSDGAFEKHIAIFNEDNTSVQIITEGNSADIHPSFSRENPNTVYYASAGLSLDSSGHYSGFQGIGKYGIMRLDLSTGDLDEILCDGKYDYIKPKEINGKIYCIRRGGNAGKDSAPALLDILLIPFKLVKAIFGFLNTFTQLFGGDSLTRKTEGANPAKLKEKSERELFIEGNLINAEKNLKENAAGGEKYPGVAPKNWELISIDKDGNTETIKKAVLDYGICDEFIIYSNGRHIVKIDKDNCESQICAANIATSISFL